ncbi:DUF4013 domain-containing protein [Methanobacterium oryzae]|uniref:DUF4013 domain-containing protein n=1 Tax=Methanobacterium oryzae TaxID=69540 RepID=UPI003D260293
MQIGKIVKDSLKYPFTDWKKFLILGIIILIYNLSGITDIFGVKNSYIIGILAVIGFIIVFLVNGYLFRVIKLSLDEKAEFPEFNNWINTGIEGLKVFTANIVYFLPAILITFILTVFYGSYLTSEFQVVGLNTFEYSISLISVVIPEILNLLSFLFIFFQFIDGIEPGAISIILIGMLYIIVIIPIFSIAIANMAHYESELRAAFRFGEIIEDIKDIKLKNLIIWYIVTGITVLILYIIANIISYALSFIHPIIPMIIMSIIFLPYIYIYVAKSLALMYISE